jgi:hypothetical protein
LVPSSPDRRILIESGPFLDELMDSLQAHVHDSIDNDAYLRFDVRVSKLSTRPLRLMARVVGMVSDDPYGFSRSPTWRLRVVEGDSQLVLTAEYRPEELSGWFELAAEVGVQRRGASSLLLAKQKRRGTQPV